MSDENNKLRIRVLGYIERRFLYGLPGFILDVTIEVAPASDEDEQWVLLDHLGDDKFYEKFETAAEVVRNEIGITMELLPDEQQVMLSDARQLVSACVIEFAPTSKSRQMVEEESRYLRGIRRANDSFRPGQDNKN